jgi:signal transduction histidine kinase/CheY-like chemotaxis protein
MTDQNEPAELLKEKAAHITTAARSATLANVLAPLLCIPMFEDDLPSTKLLTWLAYMFIFVTIRTWMIYRLAYTSEKIVNPQRHLRIMTLAIGMVGIGWGLGWVLMAPDLSMVNRMIYVYMTTAAMISSMFAYSVNRATFYAFTLPIMVPSLAVSLLPQQVFPWPFTVGLATLYLVVLSISKNFSKIFEDSVRLRFRNERLYSELASERDQSVAANVAKSKFIAAASHDLRQPMHAINVYLELIEFDKLPAPEKRVLSKIKNSIGTLNAMFDSLLNISKLDADAMQVNRRVFPIQTLAHSVTDMCEVNAKNKGLQLQVHPSDLVVRGDKMLLQQIIGNLVANAIQYTLKGQVDVHFKAVEGCLTIEVTDTGCGIAPSEQHIIFEQFYRTEQTRSLHDGLGLGLSIVQRLCALIGANIQLVSEMGRGSTFTVSTPFPASRQENQLHEENIQAKSKDPRRSLQGRNIVLIEDNLIIIEAYRQALASKGAHVHVLSENDLEAQLETMGTIDCILSDYRLGQTTGDVLIQKLRDSYNLDIPAIIVTADTSPSHIHYFSNLNIQVLHKPVSFQEVGASIERAMAGT